MTSIESFDFVVIGAGSAGCVVAHRLSESGRHRVLVLEAGGSDRTFNIRVPIGYGRSFTDPRVNWMYEAQPDPGIHERSDYWPRGKVLGGSGSINALVHVRGLPDDYDDWESHGNPGWSFKDVLPYFKKMEDHCWGASDYHGSGGPLRVTDISAQTHPLCRQYIEACAAIGFAYTADFNGPQPEGVGIYQVLTRNGFRESTATAYLRPALKSSNLTVRTRRHVTRILLEGGRAIGVAYRDKGGAEFQVRASISVVLSGGAINSPQLLQLSGIGPRALLERHGIPVILDAPAVGRYLQDHLGISYFFRSHKRTLNNELSPWYGKLKAAAQYLIHRTGPLSMSVNQGGGFVRSDPGKATSNLQLYFTPASYTTALSRRRRLLRPDPFAAFLLGFNACRPSSRGYLEIQSVDPFAAPAIHPRYLSSDEDIADVQGGIRLLRRLAGTRPLADLIAGELLPGSNVQSAEALLEDFRQRAGTVYHPSCTCRMGPDPRTSVVDPRLRVHGISGLRVMDASVFPAITSGNTNAPTIMVAEKGAALLLADHT